MGLELNLREKGSLVQSLWSAVGDASGSLANVPGLVRRVLETEAWRERVQRGKTYTHPTFLSFITTKPLAGCGWPPEKIEVLLKDEPETLALFRAATVGRKGAHHDNVMMKAPQGNSRAYTLDRLKRERPDLFAKVTAGKLSANAAAIEAGFRKVPQPIEKARKLLPKLTDPEWHELKDAEDKRRGLSACKAHRTDLFEAAE
jgi:hypothetical protein